MISIFNRVTRFWPIIACLLIAAIGMGITFSLRGFMLKQETARLQVEFDDSIKDHKQALVQACELKMTVLKSIRSLFEVGGDISRKGFHDFVAPYIVGLSSVQALEWIPDVPCSQRAQYEKAARDDGLTDFQVKRIESGGKIRPAGDSNEYFPVYYVEPYSGNEAALGVDLGSNPARREALTRAYLEGQAIASEGIRLVQEKQEQVGILIFLPVYKTGMVPQEMASRHDALRGFILGVFRIGDLMTGALSRLHRGDLQMSVRDNDSRINGGLLYTYNGGEEDDWDGRSAPPAVAGILPKTEPFHFCGRTWQLTFAPGKAFVSRQQHAGTGVLVGGIALTLALAGYVLILINKQQKLERKVQERTVSLELSRAALQSLTEEQALLLDNIETHIWHLIAPDVYGAVNKAHADFVGKPKAAFTGTPLHAILRPEEAQVCIEGNKRVFREKTAIRTEEWLIGIKGEPRLLKITKVPKFRVNGEVEFIVCSGEDITELRQLQEQLAKSQAQYQAVVEDQFELICRYTSDCTLTFVNRAYANYWHKRPEELIGSNWLDLLPESARSAARQHLQMLTHARPTSSYEHEVFDVGGRIRWQQWVDRALFDEQGNIVEYQSIGRDITDRVFAEKQLAREKGLLQSLINSIPDLFFHKDVDGKYIGCNKAFEKLIGRKEKDIIGLSDQDLFPPELANAYRLNDLLTMNEGKPRRDEEWITYPDGRRALVETLKTPHAAPDGQISGVIGIARDITRLHEAERTSMEAHRKLLNIREEEYRRIAEELHEVVCQDIITLQINLKNLMRELSGQGCETIRDSLAGAAESCKKIVGDTRQICYSLYPSGLDKLGLVAALQDLEKTGQRAGVKVNVHGVTQNIRLPRTMEIAFYRVAQEALNNAIRHGMPTQITVILEHQNEGVSLRVTDNGRGFESGPQRSGLGLTIMQERMKSVGGTVKITSLPGKTTVLATAPVGGDF